MSLVGRYLQPFPTQPYHRGKCAPVTSAGAVGKWSVFFFYLADFTIVCPTEFEDLADIYPTLRKMDIEFYVLSSGTHLSHTAWHESSPAIGKANY